MTDAIEPQIDGMIWARQFKDAMNANPADYDNLAAVAKWFQDAVNAGRDQGKLDILHSQHVNKT